MTVYYRTGGFSRHVLGLFKMRGSVFPFAFMIAMPAALFSSLLEWLVEKDYLRLNGWGQVGNVDARDDIMNQSAVWGGFTFLVGFLIVFRTSIAYNRFWGAVTATHKMRSEWFDACSCVIAFTKYSSEEETAVLDFQNTLIRLFSLLHAVALAEIEDSTTNEAEDLEAFCLDLIDDWFIDDDSLVTILNSDVKVELTFQWIQQLIAENVKTGILSIPPPLLSRAFQELANGMVQFHEALKVATIPFPFPYAQTCDFLLVVHWLMTPIVATQWVNSIPWCAVFTFIQVFVFWSLNGIADQIENPFGMEANDLEQQIMQDEMNSQLLVLVDPSTKRTPSLASEPGFGGNCDLFSAWQAVAVRRNEGGQPLSPKSEAGGGTSYDSEGDKSTGGPGWASPKSSGVHVGQSFSGGESTVPVRSMRANRGRRSTRSRQGQQSEPGTPKLRMQRSFNEWTAEVSPPTSPLPMSPKLPPRRSKERWDKPDLHIFAEDPTLHSALGQPRDRRDSQDTASASSTSQNFDLAKGTPSHAVRHQLESSPAAPEAGNGNHVGYSSEGQMSDLSSAGFASESYNPENSEHPSQISPDSPKCSRSGNSAVSDAERVSGTARCVQISNQVAMLTVAPSGKPRNVKSKPAASEK